MKDQIISLETAKIAKSKGFVEECEFFYNAGSGWKLQSDPIIRTGEDEFLEAPTQSLLQRWLREVHKIHVSPMFIGPDTNKYQFRIDRVGCTGEYSGWFDSWEQALEEGLKKGLELI